MDIQSLLHAKVLHLVLVARPRPLLTLFALRCQANDRWAVCSCRWTRPSEPPALGELTLLLEECNAVLPETWRAGTTYLGFQKQKEEEVFVMLEVSRLQPADGWQWVTADEIVNYRRSDGRPVAQSTVFMWWQTLRLVRELASPWTVGWLVVPTEWQAWLRRFGTLPCAPHGWLALVAALPEHARSTEVHVRVAWWPGRIQYVAGSKTKIPDPAITAETIWNVTSGKIWHRHQRRLMVLF